MRHVGLVEPAERVEQRPHVLARLERPDPEHERAAVEPIRLHHTVDVVIGGARKVNAVRNDPHEVARGIGVFVAISSAATFDTAITRRARFAAAAKPARVERPPPASRRLGHRDRRGVVHGDDEGDALERRDRR